MSYTNLSRDIIDIVGEDMNYITFPLQATRKEGLENIQLQSWYSERLGSERNRIGAAFWQTLVEEFNKAWFRKPLNEIMNMDGEQAEQELTNEEGETL